MIKIYKKLAKKFTFICLLVSSASCVGNNKIVDIKSPCVSAKDGPCEPRKSVNDWWLKSNKTQNS